MRRLIIPIAAACLFVAPAAHAHGPGLALDLADRPASAVGSGATYDGWVGGFPGQGDRRRLRVQGDFHMLNFRRRPELSVRYQVCLRGGNLPTRRCWQRRSNASGRSGINVSIWLNDRGGPGRWRAIWSVRGRRVATWRFRLLPEGV